MEPVAIERPDLAAEAVDAEARADAEERGEVEPMPGQRPRATTEGREADGGQTIPTAGTTPTVEALVREWNPAGPDHLFAGIALCELGEDGDMVVAAGMVDVEAMAAAVNAYDEWAGSKPHTKPSDVLMRTVAVVQDGMGGWELAWGQDVPGRDQFVTMVADR